MFCKRWVGRSGGVGWQYANECVEEIEKINKTLQKRKGNEMWQRNKVLSIKNI